MLRVLPPELALVLAASEATNGVAREVALAELPDAGAPEVPVQATLHYAEQALLCRLRMGLDAAIDPTRGPVCCLLKSACICTLT